jgi:ankyrin repeat protein
LDETYERVLKEIKKPNREHARRLLQCLVVAVRPLRLEELSEIIAFDFNEVEELPKLNPSWRWEDQEQALLSSCSSLVALVDTDDTRVVQFSHFSVKEFLTSSRLGTSSGDISHYHIDLEPAHTIFARACLSILLQLDSHDEESNGWYGFPLAKYAAEHWVFHAQYKDISTHLRKGIEELFNPDKPHFSAWRHLHDIDTRPTNGSAFSIFYPTLKSPASPLYYAALCGFHDLAKDLISKDPLQVNSNGGYYVSPLVAALKGKHFRIADLLRLGGANPDVLGFLLKTPLHAAAGGGDLEVLHRLIEYNADLNAADVEGYTPLYQASVSGFPGSIDAVRLLLEHGVDVDVRTNQGESALHGASAIGDLEKVRVLLEHGANVEVGAVLGQTPYQLALQAGHHEVAKLLSEYGPKSTS